MSIPDEFPSASAAPLLCAGITVYSPMVRHKMNQPGKSLGVVGLGGLGHLAVKFGKAFGLNVIVFSTSISKKEEALNLLGADKFIVSSDEQEMTVSACSEAPRAYNGEDYGLLDNCFLKQFFVFSQLKKKKETCWTTN